VNMPARTPLTAVVLAAVALAATPALASAKPGTFAGSLGVKVPKGAQAGIRAVERGTGAVAVARQVGRAGRFKLSLAPGAYLVVGTVVTKRGKVVQKSIGVSLKSGQKRKGTKLTARKKRKHRRKRRRGRAAFVQELGQVTPGRIAVEIPQVTGSVGEADWDALKGGINDFMTVEVMQAGTDCGTTIIEVEKRAEVIKELEFQKSPYVDPSTRLTRNFIIGDVNLRGTISAVAGDRARVEMEIVDMRTGKVLGSRDAVMSRSDWAGPLETLSKRLADDLCKLSDVFEVTVDVSGEGRFATHSGTGTIHQTLRARRDDPGRRVWRASGPLQWGNVAFTTNIPECPIIDYVIPTISWSVTILDAGDGQLQVTWLRDGNEGTSGSVDCHPTSPGDADPPPIPGMPGASLLNTGPESFLLPYAGGVQAVSGIVADQGDGFFNSGTVTVTPAGIE
jgi:hypothetical protein